MTNRKRKADTNKNVVSPAVEGQHSRCKLALPAHLELGGHQPPKKGTRNYTKKGGTTS